MTLTKERAREMGKKSSRKGVKNKSNQSVREMFNQLLENNLSQLQNDLDKLEPYQRVRAVLDLAKFVVPQMKSTEFKAKPTTFNPVILNWENENSDSQFRRND